MKDSTVDGRPRHHAPYGGERVRVLVVEDNAVNQLLVDRQLAKLGHESEIVGVAALALALLADADHGFDIVLMDWQLPDIDGLEATRRIRAIERGSTRHVPIIALTASALTSDRLACYEAGMDDFVAKPASVAMLDEVISRWAGARSPTARPTPQRVPR